MRVLLIGLAFAMCLASAQGDLKKRNVQGDGSAVLTQTECAIAFDRMETALFRVVGITLNLSKLPLGPAPARRSDVIARFDRLFEIAKPKFKFTPRRIKFDGRLFAIAPSNPLRSALEKLVKWGCVGKVAPLATSKSEVMRLDDFGSALGLFAMRIADITHRPDPKFSPYLSDGNE